MSAGDAGAWARLRLVQGASTVPSWELVAAQGEARLTVGSHPTCQWVIDDTSVDSMHLVLHWDGAALSVARANDMVSVRLDGQPVGPAFVRVGGRARLEFGRCAIVAETSAGGARFSQPPPSSVPPPSQRTSSEAMARTLLGVSAPQPSEASPRPDSVRATAAVKVGSAPPSDRPGRQEDAVRHVPKGTVVGLGPAVTAALQRHADDESAGLPKGNDEAAQRGTGEASLASTLYGIGDDARAHAVDFVSPERLRRSSVPPTPVPHLEVRAGRNTEVGFSDVDGNKGAARGERSTRVGFTEGSGRAPALSGERAEIVEAGDTRLVDDTDQMRQLSELRDHPIVARTRRLTPARSSHAQLLREEERRSSTGGSIPAEPYRPSRSPTRPPPRRSSSKMVLLVVAGMLGLGAWIYALTTL